MTAVGLFPGGSASGLAAYQRILGESASGTTASASGGAQNDFGAVLGNTLDAAVQQGATAEAQARQGLAGEGDLTKVVTSVAQAQLSLQTAATIRDRLIQAYQSIANMPI